MTISRGRVQLCEARNPFAANTVCTSVVGTKAHMCTQAGCSQRGVKLETTHVEEWPLILLEDVAAKGDTVHAMLGKMQAPHLLRKGLRCEGCNAWMDVLPACCVLECLGMALCSKDGCGQIRMRWCVLMSSSCRRRQIRASSARAAHRHGAAWSGWRTLHHVGSQAEILGRVR